MKRPYVAFHNASSGCWSGGVGRGSAAGWRRRGTVAPMAPEDVPEGEALPHGDPASAAGTPMADRLSADGANIVTDLLR